MASIMPLVRVNDKTPLELMLEFGDNPESLSEYTSMANLRPITLIEDNISRLPEDTRNDILQSMLTLYSSWYLQAAFMSLRVDGITVREILNPLSTNPSIRNSISISTESSKNYAEDRVLGSGLSLDDLDMEDAKLNSKITENANLMVGKIIDVPLNIPTKEGDKAATMPITITLAPRVADIDFMVDLFKFINKDQSWVERWHRWNAGEIKSLTDYIFALDVVREERDLMMRDKDGIYSDNKARRAKGHLTTILSGKKSVNVASTLTVITKSSAAKLESVLDGGNLRKFRTRQAFFKETGSMMLVVVNPDRNTLNVYTRGIEDHATYSFRDIRNAGSSPSAGLDISTAVASLSRGTLPGLR